MAYGSAFPRVTRAHWARSGCLDPPNLLFILQCMALATRRALTHHDYRELPEHGPRYQLVEGELHMAPAPNRYHQTILINLFAIFIRHLDQHPELGKIYIAPFDVQLTDINVYQPDLIFVLDKHKAIFTDQGAEGAPDLVVEILSPKTAKLDTGTKREIYARTGVEELWIVDPATRRIMVFRLQENAESPAFTVGDEASIQTPLLPGLTVSTAAVFHDSLAV